MASADGPALRSIPKKIAPSKEVAERVATWEAKVSSVVDVPIGEARHRVERPELRKLVEQAMAEGNRRRHRLGESRNIRDFIPQGTILARAI